MHLNLITNKTTLPTLMVTPNHKLLHNNKKVKS